MNCLFRLVMTLLMMMSGLFAFSLFTFIAIGWFIAIICLAVGCNQAALVIFVMWLATLLFTKID